MTSVRAALLISFVLTNGITVLQFSSSLIISRLLSPKEIGVYSVAAAIIAIAQLFRNVGVANYLVSEKDLSHDKIRAAFGVQLVTSWVLALLVFAVSGPVAILYREEGVQRVMMIASISFLLAPFGGVTVTLLLREMRYRERAIVDISSAFVHATLSVSLAYAGFGYMSLAWAALGNTVTTVCLGALFRPVGMPWLPNFREAKNVLSFSIPTAGADILRYLRDATPELVIGRVIGFDAVAFLSRATGLIGLFNSVIGQAIYRVAFAYFPKEYRSGGNINSLFLKAEAYLCVTALPFFATLAVMAEPVIRLLFGDQWIDSIILVRILAVAAIVGAPFSITPLVLNATGHTKKIFNIEILVFLFTALLIVPAATIGKEAVAGGLILVSLVYGAICFKHLNKVLGVTMREIFVPFLRAIPVLMAAIVIPIIMLATNISEKDWVMVLAGGFGATTGWLIAIFATRHPIRTEIIKLATHGRDRLLSRF